MSPATHATQPVRFTVSGPYDLILSLRAAASFGRNRSDPVDDAPEVLRSPVRIAGAPTTLEVRQLPTEPGTLEATARPAAASADVTALARRLVNADLDLEPFYELVRDDRLFGPLTTSLRGLKAFRPATLFEMLVTAVIEQQISLMAAHHIRGRLVERFGESVDDLIVFPAPDALAEAPLEALRECGLSHRKAEYIGGLAQLVSTGAFDTETLADLPDDEVRARISAIRGFGRWSAEYLLIRGLGRPDVVPVDDLGIQTLLGRLLGDGKRLTPDDVREVLEPLTPYRGVAVFYLLAGTRLGLA